MKTVQHKYIRVRELLREKIESGVYQPGTCLPTFSKMSKDFGVSENTLLNALRDLEQEGLLTRRRGSGTMVADKNKRPLLPGVSLKIGIVCRMPVNLEALLGSFAGDMIKGILEENGVDFSSPKLILSSKDPDQGKFIWEEPIKKLRIDCICPSSDSLKTFPELEKITSGSYDGLLLLGITDEGWVERVAKLGIPLVLVDYPGYKFLDVADQIFANPQTGIFEAVKYFQSKGVKKIHFLGALINPDYPVEEMDKISWKEYSTNHKKVDPDSYIRLNAYRQAMQLLGVPYDESYVHFSPYGKREIEKLANKLLEREANDLKGSAFICHGLNQAEHLIEACSAHGLKVLAAGGANRIVKKGEALPILIDGCEMGKVGAEILNYKLLKGNKRHLNIGVNMKFISDV